MMHHTLHKEIESNLSQLRLAGTKLDSQGELWTLGKAKSLILFNLLPRDLLFDARVLTRSTEMKLLLS